MTADEPWSGHYGDDDEERSPMPVLWSMAHTTQFTAPTGWRYGPVHNRSVAHPFLLAAFLSEFIGAQ